MVAQFNAKVAGLNINEVYKGLSRMRGNSHVRFLGEEQPVMVVPYPTFAPNLKRKSRSEYSGFFYA